MPLSSLLFRKKPDAASASKPPQQLMHRASPPPPLLLPAVAFTKLPLLGLKTIADAYILRGDGHHCVKGSSVYFSSSSSACSSSFASSFMSTPSPTRSDLSAVLDRKVDEEDNHSEKGNTEEEEEEGETEEERDEGEEGGGDEDDERFCWASYGKRSGVRRLPPPISVLAKAGEKRCLMPWVLRRSYEVGGRLVMREVKVENQEYLKPCRAGGRLTLKLIHLQEPEPSATSSPSTPTQAKSPTAPVPVRASSTPRSGHAAIPPLAMQSPRTLPRSSSEKVGRTGNPVRAAWRPVWSREDSGVDVQRRRGALTLAASSLATLSSSLPEASTMGCYANARPDSLFGMMAAARMPPVHS
ncbi:hypothetical protein Taro_029245 [Colocasia esculenta]|uniref:FAF domain-containing protein n=1 Tax=Colocasia esculenta TaxID=4460 RepID=A0A843VSQ2_COLES|nr:hypothetical protein [Colocasia esculenta]